MLKVHVLRLALGDWLVALVVGVLVMHSASTTMWIGSADGAGQLQRLPRRIGVDQFAALAGPSLKHRRRLSFDHWPRHTHGQHLKQIARIDQIGQARSEE